MRALASLENTQNNGVNRFGRAHKIEMISNLFSSMDLSTVMFKIERVVTCPYQIKLRTILNQSDQGDSLEHLRRHLAVLLQQL